MIRQCTEEDLETICEIINDAAQVYRGIIAEDLWHEPYMSREELTREIDDGVEFWGHENDGSLTGVMGIQDKGDVTLIRHAYVRTEIRKRGIGTRLLKFLEDKTHKPILIGTWADSSWAINFYSKNGYRTIVGDEKNSLLKKYWTIPDRQAETSVVLANKAWRGPGPIVHGGDGGLE